MLQLENGKTEKEVFNMMPYVSSYLETKEVLTCQVSL